MCIRDSLNTGGVKLTDQEIRNCIFKGDFINFIKDLSQKPDFVNTVKLNSQPKTDGIPVEQKVVAMFMAICPAFPIRCV